VARHGIDCDLHWGHMHVATKPRQRAELLELQAELAARYDYHSPRFLERDDVEALLATTRYCAGLHDPRSGHLHPLNYTLGLAQAAVAAGVRIFEGSPVTHIRRGDPLRLVTPRGTITARQAVLTRGGYVAGLHAPADWRVMPVGTYVVATEPLGEDRIAALVRLHDTVNPDIVVEVQYLGPAGDDTAWGSPDKAKEIALGWYAEGADIIYTAAGGSGAGTMPMGVRQ
jgi:gamma-glutamylputrescine oxidase